MQTYALAAPPMPQTGTIADVACPLCGGATRILLELRRVPVHVGVLWPTREAAEGCGRGDIVLAHCPDCGFTHNAAFDPALGDYSQDYDNALHHSAVFRETDRWLAERLIARAGLSGGEVLEIGCGGGHFLGLVCALSGSHGTGYDPSHDPARADPLLAGRAQVHRRYFDASCAGASADLVICRQVLEHVPDPVAFLTEIRAGLAGRPDALVHIDVPDGGLALRKLSLGDILYEHCSYFLPSTLARAMTEAGFEVTGRFRLFEGQFLGVEARVGDGPARHAPPGADPALAEIARTFPARFAERRAHWRARLDALSARGARAVVWGAGARAVGFFNYLGVGDEVPVVVDVNPRKHGAYLTGTGQRIVAPEELVAYRPEIVILMNGVYEAEVAATLRDLGVDAQIETVLA